MTEYLQKVKDLLLLRKCSDRTITNYLSCINRFKNYYKRKDLKKLNEDDIIEYLKKHFKKLKKIIIWMILLLFIHLDILMLLNLLKMVEIFGN